ncbi:hypothetical protein Anas_09868 [Armadillidium nasatum]|uniref:Uncharacterized protein n=1 Tax=Armadillidium nasatum TaxID=96803 RepID=A0A5N5TDZ3_9CRUS|nr:hypothetical protein Anas_09868 [Armadillidium nasatum]
MISNEDLEELQNTFDILEILVYEVGLNTISLQKFEVLSDVEKLGLLLSTKHLFRNIRRWGQTFLNHCETREKGLGKKLLREYIVSTAVNDLSIPLKTIQHSQQDMADPILDSPEEVLRVAVESVYAM